MIGRIESARGPSSSSSSASAIVWPSAPPVAYASSSISTISSSRRSNHSVSGVSTCGNGEFGSGSSITSEDETFLAEALLLEESYAASHTKSHSEPATSSSAATQMVRVISSNGKYNLQRFEGTTDIHHVSNNTAHKQTAKWGVKV